MINFPAECNTSGAAPLWKSVKTNLLDEPVTSVRRPVPFEEFVLGTGDRMLRTAVLLTGDRDTAEDLVQSAYAQAFARWRLVARAENPTAYTRAILTRLFLSDRRRKRVAELPLLPGTDTATTDVDATLRLSLLDALRDAPATGPRGAGAPLLPRPPRR